MAFNYQAMHRHLNLMVVTIASSLVLLSQFATSAFADTQVNVVGLFNNKAVVIINGGKPQTLSVGQVFGEVKLIDSNSLSATFLIEGKRKVLSMGQAANVGASGNNNHNTSVTLYANSGGHHVGQAIINGVSLKYIVDTGATTVAMNSGDAKYANIDFIKGTPMQASTASGMATAYYVKLNTVKLGGITLNNVDAVVIEGGFPQEVLMGNSVLTRLEMKREGIALTLTKKY